MPSEPFASAPLESLAKIRDLLSHIDQIDRQSGAMIATLSDAASVSNEVRARASLDIAVLITRLEESVAQRERHHVHQLSALAEELIVANADVRALRASMDELESRLLQAVAVFTEEPQLHQSENKDAPQAVSESSLEAQESIIIEAVPNAVTGFAIQRFLESIPEVLKVTARSFSNGELHFDLQRRVSEEINFELERRTGAALVSTAKSDATLRFALIAPEWFVRES